MTRQIASTTPAAQDTTPLPQFLGDQPCTDPQRIRFGHDEYVAAIQDAVAACPTPFAIGLYGKWGTGKTTVLEGLRSTLHNQSHHGRHFKVCLFDAWKYSEEASLRRQFLAVLNEDLKLGWDLDSLLYRPKEEQKVDAGAVRQNLKTTICVFGTVALGLLVGYWAVRLLGGADLANVLLTAAFGGILAILIFVVNVLFDLVKISTYRVTHPLIFAPEQFEEQFRSMLKKANVTDDRRLVVLVDNLDRCGPEAAVSALRTIKTFLEHEGCVFVVACDEAALVRHLASATRGREMRRQEPQDARDQGRDDAREAERDAKEFLRKFFQSTMQVEPLAEDLRDFASELVDAAGLQDGVATVVWAASPRDPRRIIEFLNRLTLALHVVVAREQSGRLPHAVVSRNHAYLAKILWLKERWRDFIEDCGRYPHLLELADKAILYPAMVSDHPALAKYLADTPRRGEYAELYQFMEATLQITVPDPRPFLALQVSAVDMGIADAQAFRDKLRQGQMEQVASQVSAVTDRAELLGYKEIMTRTIEEELRRDRRVEAIQTCRGAVACFDWLPEPRQHLADMVCRTIRGADPQRDIPTLTQSSLLSCMAEASTALCQPASTVVVRSLDHTSPHTGEFFAALAEHGELLDSEGWGAVGEFLLNTLSAEPQAALEYLGAIESDSAAATALFAEKPDILTQLAGMFTTPDVDLAGKLLDTFGRFSTHADAGSMNQLAVSVARLVNGPPEQRVEGYAQRMVRALGELDVLKMSADSSDQLHGALHRVIGEPGGHEEVVQFLTHDLRIYTLGSELAKQQTLQSMNALVSAWPGEKLSLLGDVIWAADLEPVRTAFVEAAGARASDPQRSAEDIEQVIAALATIGLDAEALTLSTALGRMLERPERPMKELGAKNAATYRDRLPRASLHDLVKSVHRQYMGLPAAESGAMATHLLQLVDTRSPADIRNSFADRLKTETVHDDPAIRRAAAQHYRDLRRRAKLSQDTRKTVAQDVAEGLHALRQRLTVDDRPLFDVLLEEQDNPRILKVTWDWLGNTIESLLHSDYALQVRRMACELVSQFHMLPEHLHDGILEQLEIIAADESLPQEIRDDASSAVRGLGEAAE